MLNFGGAGENHFFVCPLKTAEGMSLFRSEILFAVQALPCKGRTKEAQGDILAPGDLMVELQEISAWSDPTACRRVFTGDKDG